MVESLNKGVLVIIGDPQARGGLQTQMRALVDAFSQERETTVLSWHRRARRGSTRQGAWTLIEAQALASWGRDHRPAVERVNTAVSITSGVLAALRARGRWSSVLAAGLNPEGVVAALSARPLGRPYVLTPWAAGPQGNVGMLMRSSLGPLWWRLLRSATGFVAQTNEIADELRGLDPPVERVHVLPTGVDLQAFSPSDQAKRDGAKEALALGSCGVALFLGRLDLRHKRLDLLLDGWDRARPPGWRLVLAGDGPDREAVRKLAERVDPPVLLLGWQDDVRPLLDAADLLVLPTNSEGFSNAVAEAMASGLPVLVSDTGWQNGLDVKGVVPVRNEPGAWASILHELAAEEERRHVLGREARSWAERNCDIRKRARAIGDLLDA